MITSFIQYLLMAPSYIAVLNVYAVRLCQMGNISYLMCSLQSANVHNVSWGTKGDNKVGPDLGATTAGKNKNEVEVAVPTTKNDINAAYEDAIHVLSTKPPKAEAKRDAATEHEDYYRTSRANVLLAWTLSNVRVAGFWPVIAADVALFAVRHCLQQPWCESRQSARFDNIVQ